MRRVVLGIAVFAAFASSAAARTINWSGYTWDVRSQGLSGPGPNLWSDSTANVSVNGSELDLAITHQSNGWASSEIDSHTHLGYGSYTWVVNSNLSASALDNNEVLGLFTYDDNSPESSHNEIDIEASHWGDPTFPTGSGTVYQTATRQIEKDFPFTSSPPYVASFDWEPGSIHWHITDATGAVVADWTFTSGIPTPATEVPIINYWRFNNVAPTSVRTMRIASFTFTPTGTPPVIPPPPPVVTPPTPRPCKHHRNCNPRVR